MKNKNTLIAGIFLALFGFQASATSNSDIHFNSASRIRKCTGNEFDKYLEEGSWKLKIEAAITTYYFQSGQSGFIPSILDYQPFLAIYSNEIDGDACNTGRLQIESNTIEFIFDEEKEELEEEVECNAESCVSYEYLGNNKVRVRRYTFSDIIREIYNNFDEAVNLDRVAIENELRKPRNFDDFKDEVERATREREINTVTEKVVREPQPQ